MKNLFTVIKFTMKEKLKKKSFIISTIIILLLIVLAFSVPKIITTVVGEGSKERILVVDSEYIFVDNIRLLDKLGLENYEFSYEILSFDKIKQWIEEDDIDSAIIIEKAEAGIKLRYILEDVTWTDTIPEDIMVAISNIYTDMQISKLGLSEEQLSMLNPNFEVSVEQANGEEDVDEGNQLIMMALSFVLSMAVILCATQVSTSITTEKTSKIIETLVTSTSPKTIVLGKTIGIGLVGLFQLILAIVTAIVSAKIFLDAEMINAFLDVSNITVGLGAIAILYFILGYFTFALLFALTGSMVSKPEDIQSANSPVSMICLIGFYLGYFSISIDPTSSISAFAGVFPISSPFCMPSRIMMGLASTGEIIASIVALVVMVWIIARVAIKIYSSAILNYGAKLSFKDVFKMYKNK